MNIIESYIAGEWCAGGASSFSGGQSQCLINAVNDEVIGEVVSLSNGFDRMLEYGRSRAGYALKQLTVHERAERIKQLARYLLDRKETFYQLSYMTGATKADSWVDIEGGIGTLFSYSGIARRELNDDSFIVEGAVENLSAKGSFVGQHLLTSKDGISLHINAYNFPVWGMLEKIAPSLIAGVPVIVKPATLTCYLTQAVVKAIVDSGILPAGAVQLICGGIGDTLEQLNEQDIVTFTGSAATGHLLRAHQNILASNIPFTMEADSLNCCILAPDVTPEDIEFELFIKEVVNEMIAKAGQKCTAIRRIIVPASLMKVVSQQLAGRLQSVIIGDPLDASVQMGALAGRKQRDSVISAIEKLRAVCCTLVDGVNQFSDFKSVGVLPDKGAFLAPTLLSCQDPLNSVEPHQIEAFGPVSCLMPYEELDDAIRLAKMGKGSLVGSVFSHCHKNITRLVFGVASHHGRLLINNRDCSAESTGHGSPLPALVHGGPGRAGGGEELGGVRAIKHYMQRTAIQGSPDTLMAITNQFVRGAKAKHDAIHPFKKYYEELNVGDSLETHRRTVTETDIVNFGCLSGDHFYAHFDEIAARDSFFEKRVAHGYFVISAAAGLFVEPAKGPVIANYGIDHLRFIEPVAIGDTIQVNLTVKRKTKKTKRPEERYFTGVVVWDVEVLNQQQEIVALYDILTLVERKNRD